MRFLKTQTDSGKLDKQNPQQIKPEGVEATRQSQTKDRSVDEHAYTHTHIHTEQISILAWKHHTSKKSSTRGDHEASNHLYQFTLSVTFLTHRS